MNLSSIKKQHWYCVMCLFIIFFAPPIIPVININLIFFVFAIVTMFIKYKDELKNILTNETVKKFILIYGLVTVYITIWAFFKSFSTGVSLVNNIKTAYRFLLISPVLLANLSYVICYAKRNKLDMKDILKCICIAFVIQSILALISLFVPPIRQMFINIMKIGESNPVLYSKWQLERRQFGFSNNLLDTFGLGVGMAAVIPLFFDKRLKLKNGLISIVILIAAILNSRTGFLIFFVNAGVYFIYSLVVNEDKVKTLIQNVINALILFIILAVVFIVISHFNPHTFGWFFEGFSGLYSVSTGNASEAADSMGVLFEDTKWLLPSGLDLIIGTGHTIFSGVVPWASSDVGYINDIWLVGIVGLPFLYAPFLYIWYSVAKRKNITEIFMVLSIMASFIIFNIKANVIAFNTGMAIHLLLILMIILFNNSRGEQDD